MKKPESKGTGQTVLHSHMLQIVRKLKGQTKLKQSEFDTFITLRKSKLPENKNVKSAKLIHLH